MSELRCAVPLSCAGRHPSLSAAEKLGSLRNLAGFLPRRRGGAQAGGRRARAARGALSGGAVVMSPLRGAAGSAGRHGRGGPTAEIPQQPNHNGSSALFRSSVQGTGLSESGRVRGGWVAGVSRAGGRVPASCGRVPDRGSWRRIRSRKQPPAARPAPVPLRLCARRSGRRGPPSGSGSRRSTP